MLAFKELLITSLKRYFRNRQTIFWGLFFPLVFISIFGLMNFNALGKVKLGVFDPVRSIETQEILTALSRVKTIEVVWGSQERLRQQLREGEIDAWVSFPLDFGARQNNTVEVFYSRERSQQAELVRTVLNEIIDRLTFARARVIPLYHVDFKTVDVFNLDFIDFLVPGVVGFSIMQLSIFGVAFAFVDLKKRGVFRRLLVAPINPLSFILAEALTRLVMITLQIGILFAVGVWAFGLTIVGSKLLVLLLGILGALMFLFYGFAIAGYAQDEKQVPPIANIFTLPMMLLSGVFFPTDGLPSFLRVVSAHLPLTFLVDGLREVANHGAGIGAIRQDLLGMALWMLLGLVLALYLFEWE